MTSVSVPAGILLPESFLQTEWFSILATFVAINTLIYLALAIGNMLPKIYVSDWLPRRHQRAETRSIHPDAPVESAGPADPAEPVGGPRGD